MFEVGEVVVSYNIDRPDIIYGYEKILAISKLYIHTGNNYYFKHNLKCNSPGYRYKSIRKLTLEEKIKYNLS